MLVVINRVRYVLKGSTLLATYGLRLWERVNSFYGHYFWDLGPSQWVWFQRWRS